MHPAAAPAWLPNARQRYGRRQQGRHGCREHPSIVPLADDAIAQRTRGQAAQHPADSVAHTGPKTRRADR